MAFGVWHTLLLYQLYFITKVCYVKTHDYFYHEKHEQIRIIAENNLELFKNKFKQIGGNNDSLLKYNLNNNSDIVMLVIALVDDLNETESRTFWLRMNPNFVSDYDITTEVVFEGRRARPAKFRPNLAAFVYMRTTTLFPPEKWAVRNKTFIHNQYREIYQVLYDNNIIVTRNTRRTKSRKKTLRTTTEPEILPPKHMESEEDEDYSMPPMEMMTENDTNDSNSTMPGDTTTPKLLRCGKENNQPCILARGRAYDETNEFNEDDETMEAPELTDGDTYTEMYPDQGREYPDNLHKFGYITTPTDTVVPNNNYYYQGKQFYYGYQKK